MTDDGRLGRLLDVRGPADLRAQAARRDPARRDARRRRQPIRSLEDVHRGDDLRRDAARAATSRRRASTTSRSRGVDGSLAFPTFPRFCGQTFMEGNDLELGLECVRAYNDWMIEDWCADSDGHLIPLCLIPLWDVDLAVAEVERNAARGARAICFSEIPTHLGLPSIHTGYWDPLFAMCQETRTDAVHAHRIVVEDAGRVARRAAVDRHHAVVQQLDGVARRLPVLGRARALPDAEARVLRRPDRLDPVRARAGRQRVGVPLELDGGRRRRSPSRRRPTTAAGSSAASRTTCSA